MRERGVAAAGYIRIGARPKEGEKIKGFGEPGFPEKKEERHLGGVRGAPRKAKKRGKGPRWPERNILEKDFPPLN